MMAPRRDSARLAAYVATSRSMIRVIMLVLVLLGFMLIFNEILEQTVLCDAGVCGKIHWSPMGWGLAFIVLGCLAIQKGDMSLSLKEFGDFGDRVVTWRERMFGRRAYDRAAAEACETCTMPLAECSCPDETPAARTHAERDD